MVDLSSDHMRFTALCGYLSKTNVNKWGSPPKDLNCSSCWHILFTYSIFRLLFEGSNIDGWMEEKYDLNTIKNNLLKNFSFYEKWGLE